MNCELAAEGTQFLKPRGGIAHDGGNADHPACIIRERHNSKLDRDSCAVLPHTGDRQELAVAVAGLPGAHRGPVPVPMPLTQIFGNYDVKRTADCFCLRETEDAGCTSVPRPDHALGVCIDDRIRHAGNKTFGEIRWVKVHDFLPAPSC